MIHSYSSSSGKGSGAGIQVLHLVHGSLATDYFRDLGHLHDPRYKLWLGTLGATDERTRKELEANGVSVVQLGSTNRAHLGITFFRICAFLRTHRIDIINTHLFDPSAIGMLAALTAPRVGRVLTRHHSDLHWQMGKRWHSRIDAYSARLAHCVIGNSRWTIQVLTENEGLHPSKARLIHTGIDFSRRHYPDADERLQARIDLGVQDGFVLTIAGRLHPAKGQSTAIRALPDIQAVSPKPVYLLIAGTGPDEANLKQLSLSLGIPNVRFLGFRQDVDTLFSISDVVLVPSVEEAFGQVTLEAMAQERPVVASRVGGIPEVVIHGETGFLHRPGSETELQSAVTELLQDGTKRTQMGRAGRERAHKEFAAEGMVRRYEEVFEDVLRRQRKRPA